MKRIFFLLVVFLPQFCFSQLTNVWKFGNGAGLDFNSGSPVPLPPSGLWAPEGTASVCDGSGNLLFYTNGNEARDRNGNIMPNGSGLSGGTSTTQTIIVPKPGDCGRYYIFQASDHLGPAELRYSLVDMCLNNGLGDVVVTQKNIFLFAPISEKIAAVRNSNGTDVWVVTHELSSAVFRAYPVTTAGVGTPVLSTIGNVHASNCMIGSMKASHNGQKLVVEQTFCNSVELFDFNTSSGTVSNAVNLSSQLGLSGGFYGAEFSPDDQLLYLSSTWINDYLLQVNLAAMTSTQIAMQSGNYIFGQLQLGPDGKIYMARGQQSFIDVIANPNVVGAGCNYQSGGQPLAAGTFSDMGLPNFITDLDNLNAQLPLSFSLGADTTVPCNAVPFTITAGNACLATYLWQDNSTADSFIVNNPGVYWVDVSGMCGTGRDSIVVTQAGAGTAQIHWEHMSCAEYSFSTDSVAGGVYSWDFGDGQTGHGTSVIHGFPATGTFTVTLNADYGGNCNDAATVVVNADASQPPMTVPNVFTPNGDGINDEFVIDGLVECTPFVLEIYDRWGVLLFSTEHPVFVHWQGKSMDGKPVTDGVYYYILYSELYTTTGFITIFR